MSTFTGVNSLMKFCTSWKCTLDAIGPFLVEKLRFARQTCFLAKKYNYEKARSAVSQNLDIPSKHFLSLFYRSRSLSHTLTQTTHSHTNSIIITPIYLSLLRARAHTHTHINTHTHTHTHNTLSHSLTFISEWIMVHKPFH